MGIHVGSRDETIQTSGVAHFLEHLSFKGTNKRTRIHIEKGVEEIGAKLNAYTSREFTIYHMQTIPENIDFAMDMLSDILLCSKY